MEPMIKEFQQSNYPEVKQWWEGHKWPVIPFQMLPKTGYIIENVCAGWLYRSDSPICWVEWIISNPASEKIIRNESLNLLIDTLINKAKSEGFSHVFTSVKHPGLIKRYESHGFTIQDSNVTHMIRSL